VLRAAGFEDDDMPLYTFEENYDSNEDWTQDL